MLTTFLVKRLQEQINDLRNKQANCPVSERATIQAQIRQLQAQLDALQK